MIDPRSDRTTGYHLFLQPDGELQDKLEDYITRFAKEYGGPVFPAHVTLLARVEDVDIIEKTWTLVRELSPFSLTLGAIDGEDEYFRSLYIRIEEDGALTGAHRRANELFGCTDERPYEPHASLFYGLLGQEEKVRMRNNAERLKEERFIVSSVHLYETQGTADMWKKIGEFPFGS